MSEVKIAPIPDLGQRTDEITIYAGPCSVESEEQVVTIAKAVKASGATMLRGGAFKPRTSPYAFQGLGEQGLAYLRAAKEETGLPITFQIKDHAIRFLESNCPDKVCIHTGFLKNDLDVACCLPNQTTVLITRENR